MTNGKRWTKKEDDFLKQNYLKKTNKKLVDILNRSYASIDSRLRYLRLKRPKNWVKQMGIFKKENNPFYDKKHSKKNKQKWSSIKKNKSIQTEQSKRNISKSLKKAYKEKRRKSWNKGLTKDTHPSLRKMGLDRKGKYKGKKAYWYNRKRDLKTRKKIRDYHNLPEVKEIDRQRMIERRPFMKCPSKDSKIEIAMQNELKKREIIFETHKPIKGIPDVFIKPNICIFCDGDFFHGYNWKKIKQYLQEKNNINRIKRIKQTRKKDKQITKQLRFEGYIVLRSWEHQIKKDVQQCVNQIEKIGDNNSRFKI